MHSRLIKALHLHFSIVGRNNARLKFSQPFPAYIAATASCCPTRYGVAFTMWLKLKVLPANLVRLEQGTGLNIVLNISANGDIQLSVKSEIARLVATNFV